VSVYKSVNEVGACFVCLVSRLGRHKEKLKLLLLLYYNAFNLNISGPIKPIKMML